MKKITTLLCGFFLLATLGFTQTPAGTAVHMDYDDFQNDNIRRYVNCGNAASLNPGDDLTIEAWVRIHDSGWNQKIIGKLNPSFNSGYMLAVDQGKIYPEIWNPSQNELLVGFIPPLGFWVHFATTFTAGDSMRAYVNGEKVGAVAVGPGTIASNNDPLIIGIAPWDLSNFQFFGDLDEVKIWGTTRTEAQINEWMFKPLTGNTTGLLAYYKFEEGSGVTVADASGNGNTGNFVGLTTTDWSTSYAVIGNSSLATANDLNAIWNGKQFVNPRFAITQNGLSLTSSDITDYSYAVYGHDGGTGTSTADVPSSLTNPVRTDRIWKMNAEGDINGDLTFDLANAAGGGSALDNSKPAAHYGLLHRGGSTGNFALVAVATSIAGNIVTFDGQDLMYGEYALVVADDAITVGRDKPLVNSALLQIWPNPAQGELTLAFGENLKTASLQLTNLMGQTVLDRELGHLAPGEKVQLECAQFPAGIYYLRLQTESGTYTRKLRLE